MNVVDKTKYNLLPVYITSDGKWFSGDKLLDLNFYKHFDAKMLKEVCLIPSSKNLYIKHFYGFKKDVKIDCAIISCHGKNGEDGSVQGLLELAQIPYQSSGILGSAIGLDKSVMKQIFKHNKIPITNYIEVTKSEFEEKNNMAEKIIKKIPLPVIVKPNTLGSSIGISVCKTLDELNDSLSLAFLFDNKALVEKYIENLKEVNIAVLGDEHGVLLSRTEEVINNGFLFFDKKYMQNGQKTAKKSSNSSKNHQIPENLQYGKLSNSNQNAENGMQNMGRIIPANITKSQQNQIEKFAKNIFSCTNSKGVVRIDFMIDKSSGKVYANELNAIPGSFAFYLWEKSGINFSDLVDKLVYIAEKDFLQKSKLTTTFTSCVLSQNGSLARK